MPTSLLRRERDAAIAQLRTQSSYLRMDSVRLCEYSRVLRIRGLQLSLNVVLLHDTDDVVKPGLAHAARATERRSVRPAPSCPPETSGGLPRR